MQRAKEDLLVVHAQQGSVRAFEALYRHYAPLLARFAYRLCGDEQLALDAVQDAWITLSKTLRRLEDPRGFRSWAYKTVRWRVVDQLRKKPEESDALNEGTCATEQNTVLDATPDQLSAHLSQLSGDDRQVIFLFYLEELKISEIAHVLDIPVGTVKSRLNRARTQLRQQMTGEE